VTPSILAVTSELPWPLTAGGRLRTYLLRQLAAEFRVRLVAGVPHDQQGTSMRSRTGILVRPAFPPPRAPLAESGGCRVRPQP
jgi:hypothetical protein